MRIPFRICGRCGACEICERPPQPGQDHPNRSVEVHATPQLFRRDRAVVGHLAGGARRQGWLVGTDRTVNHHLFNLEGFGDSYAGKEAFRESCFRRLQKEDERAASLVSKNINGSRRLSSHYLSANEQNRKSNLDFRLSLAKRLAGLNMRRGRSLSFIGQML